MSAVEPIGATPSAVAEQLAVGMPIAVPVAVIAAHPDEETLGLGARLALFGDWRLIHLTDGAPRDLRAARRAGCRTRAAYARVRRSELESALQALRAVPAEAETFGWNVTRADWQRHAAAALRELGLQGKT